MGFKFKMYFVTSSKPTCGVGGRRATRSFTANPPLKCSAFSSHVETVKGNLDFHHCKCGPRINVHITCREVFIERRWGISLVICWALS